MSKQITRQDPHSTRLDGTVCVVTGASRGIGEGIARELGRHEARIAVNYNRSASAADAVVEHVEADGGEAVAVEADVTDPEAIGEMYDSVRDELGPVDVLVNNAGITSDVRFDKMSRREWQEVIGVNLTAVSECTRQFYDDLIEAENGRLINISSVVGKTGAYGQTNYAAAKSGLFGFTRSISKELAPHSTTANCIAPGYTWTDMVADVPETVRDQIREDIPLGRFAEVGEVASLVRFLASPESSYITGSVFEVDGGAHL